ncbi:MAG: FliG C-terminal domain-containing protein [Pseudotabrizicola sp.]|uniref:flagellar motor switch protein FliG n=1 Tax=Pseudotabrizicola sp. TaxID=2939647 RepID=UPI002726AEBD|nr:FliG C-terminal domain-containing protein [Pseudotabrizicola sp.]MDO9637445.1 FliG C-terminal domain-containing protein [Pseudotabrizicola sp.]
MSDDFGHALARITPVQRAVSFGGSLGERRAPTPREKAAIIVRLMLAEGGSMPVTALPDHMQAALTEQIGQMRLVDRNTLSQVVEEFLAELEEVGLSFPGGIDGALTMMDGHISATAASRLRRLAGALGKGDPWERLTTLPADRILPVLEAESVEVAAVMLSKLPVPKAAELLGRLPGDKARRVAYAVSMTGSVSPETVRRIGHSLATQLDAQPARAFDAGPVERVGAILNISTSATRDDVLLGLDAEDAAFAEQVRKAIFTFGHIPARIMPRDIPKIVRMIDLPVLVTALTAAQTQAQQAAAVEFILANISQRLAQSIRDEMATRGKVKDKDAEDAMTSIVTTIRQLEGAGEIVMNRDED